LLEGLVLVGRVGNPTVVTKALSTATSILALFIYQFPAMSTTSINFMLSFNPN
jgi:hypothetical protein